MKLQLLSDLHLESHPRFVPEPAPGADLLVLAGDIGSYQNGSRLTEPDFGLGRFSPRHAWPCPVIYVPGNHEYDGDDFDAVHERLRATCDALGIQWLERETLVIDGIRFVGTTLWFPPTADEAEYRPFLADFSLIEGFVPWVHEAHARSLAFLQQEVRAGDVVVTHFLPHPGSVAPQYEGSPLNRFFLAADAQPLVEKRGARLWIHGHTHVSCDYQVGKTRVICNARGYPAEPGTSLNPALVIDV